jgi:nicotinate-nucleotide adenylyltransferase
VSTGILGGTFDPIHIAHLHAGETVLAGFELDRVVFMPAGVPYQKAGEDVSEAGHRLEMVRVAIDGVDGFEVDDREVNRDGPTYTMDTLESYPDDEDIVLILGADSALRLPTWHRWKEVIGRAHIAVVPRPGVDSMAVQELLPEASFVDMAVLEVSGTDIREMAAAGRPYRYLVTGPVYRYIEANGLYTQRGEFDSVGGPDDQEQTS